MFNVFLFTRKHGIGTEQISVKKVRFLCWFVNISIITEQIEFFFTYVPGWFKAILFLNFSHQTI